MFWYCFIAAATQTIIPGTLGFKIICEVYVNNMWEITWLLSFQNIDSTVPSCNGIFCFSSYLWTFVLHLLCDFLYFWVSEAAQSCLTLCDPVDCSPPGSSVHGILQARILEWVAISWGLSELSSRSPVFLYSFSLGNWWHSHSFWYYHCAIWSKSWSAPLSPCALNWISSLGYCIRHLTLFMQNWTDGPSLHSLGSVFLNIRNLCSHSD